MEGMSSSQRRVYREFGSWVRSRRLARRWTQDELARLLDYDVTYVRKIEWGERHPSEAFRIRLAQVLGLPVSSLPAAEPERRPGRLPVPASPLLGREREAEQLVALVEAGARLVTVLGAPGIGKTRLAVEVASRLDEGLEGGAWFVPLGPVSHADTVADAIAEALHLVPPGGSGSAQALVNRLQGQEMLLVLDNFEHLLGAATLVRTLLDDVPSLRVLVTSRQALDLAMETHFWLSPLALPAADDGVPPAGLEEIPAAALFLARARMVQPGFEADDALAPTVVEICRRLQGVPLAIELAAATARLLSPAELLSRLGHGLDLPLAGPRDAPAHHRTVRAAINWSYELLDEDERALFARLAVFGGGCTFEALTEVCDVPGGPPAALAVAASLVGKSLLEPVPDAPGGARVRALDAVRAFALERLEERGEVEKLKRRHAEYFTQLAEQTEPALTGAELVDALRVLEDEQANLRLAIGWSQEHDPELATRLVGALWRFWWIRGYLDEGRRALEAALAAGRWRSRQQVRTLNGAGVLGRTQGANALAQDLFEEAAGLATEIGDEDGQALALLNLGMIALHRSDVEGASSWFERALAIYSRLGDERGVGHALNCLGMVHVERDDLEAAASSIHKGLELFRSVGDIWSVAVASTNLGWVAHQQGRARLARSLYDQSLAVYRSLGEERGVANTLSNLGSVALSEGDTGKACGLFQEALLTFAKLGDQWGVAECLGELGVAAAEALDFERAAHLFGAVEAIRERTRAGAWPKASPTHLRGAEAVRTRLGETAFREAWERGRVGTVNEAVQWALALPRPQLEPGENPANRSSIRR
jgi:predicted ATPase/DNA-binding XRE family transcriptional regulator